MAGAGITYTIKMTQKTKDRLLDLKEASERHTMVTIARGYRHFINFRVPKDTGALRDSAIVLGNNVSAWVAWVPRGKTADVQKYLHYQFVGKVYGPNKAYFEGDAKVTDQWRSAVPAGGKKQDTGRMMGKPFIKHFADGRQAIVKGYTTKRPLKTGPDWLNQFRKDSGKYGEKAVNTQAGRYIYEAWCKKTNRRCYGGYQVYHRWRTY